MALIKQFGLHWPRNQENLDELEDPAGHKTGIYVVSRGNAGIYRSRGDQRAATQFMAKKGRKRINSGIASRGS
jgi:hypothetical protein